MADALKDMFNEAYYIGLAQELAKVDKQFNPKKFTNEVSQNLEQLSLNERLRNTSIVLKKHLPADYKHAVDVLIQTIPNLKTGYTSLVLPDFIGLYGHDDFSLSMEALKYFTQFGS
jgi:3-methyladenine DNA glycosylase AlkC